MLGPDSTGMGDLTVCGQVNHLYV